MPDEKIASQTINKILKDPSVQYGLKEFEGIKPEEVLDIFEKEKGKFYLKCLKREKDIFFRADFNFVCGDCHYGDDGCVFDIRTSSPASHFELF